MKNYKQALELLKDDIHVLAIRILELDERFTARTGESLHTHPHEATASESLEFKQLMQEYDDAQRAYCNAYYSRPA